MFQLRRGRRGRLWSLYSACKSICSILGVGTPWKEGKEIPRQEAGPSLPAFLFAPATFVPATYPDPVLVKLADLI